MSFLGSLLVSEALVIDQITVLILVRWLVIQHSLFLQDILQGLDDLIKRLTVFVVLFVLVVHDLSCWNGKDADKLA